MDTIDRSNTNLPAPFQANLPVLPDLTPALPADYTDTPALQIDPRVIVRGLGRQWWKILAIWLVLSVPFIVLIYQNIQPTYRHRACCASSRHSLNFTAPSRGEWVRTSDSTYLKTQVGTDQER